MRCYLYIVTTSLLLGSIAATATALERHVLYEASAPQNVCREMEGPSAKVLAYIPIRHTARTKEELTRTLQAVSDPHSPQYGKYLTVEEVREIVRPSSEDTDAVMEWLTSAGVDKASIDSRELDMLRVPLSPAQVTALFGGARLISCEGLGTEVQGAVSIPAHLADVVPFVTGLRTRVMDKNSRFKRAATKNRTEYLAGRKQSNTMDQGIISPKTLEALYNVPSSLYPGDQTTQAAIQFLGSGAYEPCDLTGCPKTQKDSKDLGFFNLTGLTAYSATPKIVGAFSPDGGEVEGSLDIEFLMTTGRGSKTTYWTEARWMYDFAVDFFGSDDKTDVVSMSFSWSEVHQCTQPTGQPNPTCTEQKFNSQQYVDRTNDEFQKIGLLGVTLVASSGDDGALGNFGNCTNQVKPQFDPLFPAASPWVTTVGGTSLLKDPAQQIVGDCPDVQLKCGDYCQQTSECPLQMPCAKCIMSVWACGSGCGDPCKDFTDCIDPNCALCTKGKCAKDLTKQVRDDCPTAICVQNGGCATSTHEVVCTYPNEAITSGGGFSAYTPMPFYQMAAVKNYTQNSGVPMPPSNWFNASNRGYPDVAAVSANYGVWMGMWIPTDGTSASTPVMAGFVNLLNSYRVANGKSKLGFLNPLLYTLRDENPEVFRDITEGSNECSSQCCGKVGYAAAKGWDPTTGLGSIDVGKMMGAVLKY